MFPQRTLTSKHTTSKVMANYHTKKFKKRKRKVIFNNDWKNGRFWLYTFKLKRTGEERIGCK